MWRTSFTDFSRSLRLFSVVRIIAARRSFPAVRYGAVRSSWKNRNRLLSRPLRRSCSAAFSRSSRVSRSNTVIFRFSNSVGTSFSSGLHASATTVDRHPLATFRHLIAAGCSFATSLLRSLLRSPARSV